MKFHGNVTGIGHRGLCLFTLTFTGTNLRTTSAPSAICALHAAKK